MGILLSFLLTREDPSPAMWTFFWFSSGMVTAVAIDQLWRKLLDKNIDEEYIEDERE